MCLMHLVLEGGSKSTNIGLEMGVKIGVILQKSGNNTHMVVIRRVILSQKIGLLDLTNCNRLKKRKRLGKRTKSIAVTEELVSYYIHAPYYYTHTNVDLLWVWEGRSPPLLFC